MTTSDLTLGRLGLDSGGRIAEDLLCSRCEYNLRGIELSAGSSCPECGLAVERSIRGDLARNADPRWITRVAEGLRWVFIGMLVASVVAAIVQVVGLIGWGRLLGAVRAMPRWVGHLAVVATLLPGLIGFWNATAPERSGLRPLLNPRRVARLTLPLALLLWPMWLWHTNWEGPWTNEVEIVADMLMLVGLLATFRYAQGLARRFPDVKLARQTYWCMWFAAAAFVLAALFRPPWTPILVNLPRSVTVPRQTIRMVSNWLLFRTGVEIALCIIGLSVLWVLLLLAWYRHRLREAAKVASARLASVGPGGGDTRGFASG